MRIYKTLETRIEEEEEWFNYNGSGFDGIALLADDINAFKYDYLELQAKMDVALDILDQNNYFNTFDKEEFVQSNDSLNAIMELVFNLDTYDLPRNLIVLLPLETFEKALDFLLDKLEDMDLIGDYYDLVEE